MSKYNNIFLILVLSLLMGHQASGSSLTKDFQSNEGIYPKSLTFLGSVDGKSYFADSTIMPWSEAFAYCESMNMRLASITTADQATFLINSYQENSFAAHHWLSGTDRYDLLQMSWSYTGEEPNPNVLNLIGRESERHTCLCFISKPGVSDRAQVTLERCSARARVLCEG